jgi:lysophospholipase L1-like esterase
MSVKNFSVFRTCVVAFAAAAASQAYASSSTYVSLGDSLGYGVTTIEAASIPSFGDQGYAGPYATRLATQRGGDRPNVINLAIPGETSSTFFDTSVIYRAVNLNYAGSALSQSQLFTTVAAQEAALGHTIDTVSISIGPDDFFALTDDPTFFTLTPYQQLSTVLATAQQLQNNYAAILTQLRTLAPTADLIVVGDYNPYAILPNSPLFGLAPAVVDTINQIAYGTASAFGARYIDTASAFAGHEAEYTHILDHAFPDENVHPTDLGYAAIAGLMVPAPGSGLFAVLGVCVVARRRR